MRFKVDWTEQVERFLRWECSRQERAEFASALELVREAPIANSRAFSDPNVSRYMLRRFRFGLNVALFQFDEGREEI